MFLSHLLLGTALICLTVTIHALALDNLMQILERVGPCAYRTFNGLWKALMLIITVLGVFSAHIVQIWIWALFYLVVRALPDLETALYFSTSTFTTVGYGDVVLAKGWRLISSFEAANGFMLFSWSAAFIFEIMSKLYKDEALRKTGKSK